VSKPKPPHETVFFLDECLGGGKVSRALKDAGVSFETSGNHFCRGTPDEEWLAEVGRRGWVVLTHDKGIRKHKAELLALRENHVRAFIVAAKGLRGEEIGALLVRSMPEMLKILQRTEPPMIAIIRSSSVIELKEGRKRS